MRGVVEVLFWAYLTSGVAPAVARPADRHRLAIRALEQQVVPLRRGQGLQTPAPLAQRMIETQVPGVSIAIIAEGRVRWARGYGEVAAGSGRRVTRRTTFQAASISKAVAAAGALALADRGRLSLDDDVNLRLRTWQVPDDGGASAGAVTLRQLLGHTAGLTVSGYPGYASAAVPTIAQSLAGAKPANTPAVRRYAAPGAQFGYSGGGYSAAQLVIGESAGRPFADYMRDAVLRRTGMRRSHFDQSRFPQAIRGAASGHDGKGVLLPNGGNRYPELAAAGLWTTPSDYARFLIALLRAADSRPGGLLARASAEAMTTPGLANYGLGVNVVRTGGRVAITHGGANEGYRCLFVAFLDGSREGFVVMTNGDNGGALAAAIHRTLAQAYGWPDTSAPPVPRAPY
jgi:CubicO group peptidase (beta-lactamase class C family)